MTDGEILNIGSRLRCGLIGWPVAHSLSPRLHAHAAKFCGVLLSYEAIAVPPGDAGAMVHRSAADGMRGLNVTTPHKELVVSVMTELDQTADMVRAVNTISFDDGNAITGYNTDYSGAMKLFADYLPVLGDTCADQQCLIFGTGPAARSIALALHNHARETVMLTRTQTEDAQGFARQHGIGLVQMDAVEVFTLIKNAAVLVNATPLGTGEYEQHSPLPHVAEVCRDALVIDLNYSPLNTQFLLDARRAGCLTLNGLALLAYQAADSFNLWTGEAITGYQLIEFLQSEGYEITLPNRG